MKLQHLLTFCALAIGLGYAEQGPGGPGAGLPIDGDDLDTVVCGGDDTYQCF